MLSLIDFRIAIFSLFLTSTIFLAWFWLRIWYFRLVDDARSQVRHHDNRLAPGSPPRMLIGNLPEVYGAENQLSAYHSFHRKFGEVVQIFWLWRHQISTSNYAMARQILVSNQRNYQKFPPNSLLQKLFGQSILTSTSTDRNWKRHRVLLQEIFSQKQIPDFHDIFVEYCQRLVHQWHQYIQQSEENTVIDVYRDLLALFLDIIVHVSIGKNVAFSREEADEFLAAVKYIVYQSTQPAHQFTTWWKYLPFPSNQKLVRAFQTVEKFLEKLIVQKQARTTDDDTTVLDLLWRSLDLSAVNLSPASRQQIRDNLLAIIANGHETVATCVAFCLYLLGKNPEKLARAQAEVDNIWERELGKLNKAGITKLDYLNCVIVETLRFAPSMAGLQRISCDRDNLAGWSIPAGQVIAITLEPLHHNSEYFGDQAEQFHPERYLKEEESTMVAVAAIAAPNTSTQCPIKKFLTNHRSDNTEKTQADIPLPLTFGDGARKCLGEHFAMYEMKVALATLLYHFDFQVVPDFEAELELGKFGLFLTTFPKDGVKMLITPRKNRQESFALT
jgi:cytochrome P450